MCIRHFKSLVLKGKEGGAYHGYIQYCKLLLGNKEQ